MRSIFLGDTYNINRVYSKDTVQCLKEIADLETTIYNKNSIVSEKINSKDIEFIFSTWGMPQFTEEEIKAYFPKLKAVFYAAGSVQKFAHPFLNCGVKVFSAWAANAVPVAEYTVAQIILANKGFFALTKMKNKEDYENLYAIKRNYKGNYNATVGIIGAGMIGKAVINMLKTYKLDILVYDPFLPDSKAEELGVEKVSLEELFAESDIVSNHLANNSETQGMLNYNLFASMPQYATFLNTGRGAQVVESDLIKVLKERQDVTAVLDVTFPEPPENDSELYSLCNCILTPHIAGSSGLETYRMAEYMLDEYKKFVNGQPTEYQVTAEMLKTMA